MTNQDLMKLFGFNIKHLRRQRGLSQQELANILDMERSHLVAIEGGKKATSFSTLVKLANIFECPVSQFFSTKTDADHAVDTNSHLQEFARDYKIVKTAVAEIQARAQQNEENPNNKMAVHKVSFELLSLIPFLSDNAQNMVQKFAEGYLKISKSEDPLVEQIIHDILRSTSAADLKNNESMNHGSNQASIRKLES